MKTLVFTLNLFRNITETDLQARREQIKQITMKDFEINTQKMMTLKKITDSESYLVHLENRKTELRNQIDNNWMMRTPERVENLPSPP
jgi:Zn-dependent M16 (insulinase) family peptidase